MSTQVEDKKGNAIDEGDRVFTKIKGGKREGEARIVTTQEAKKENFKTPPKGLKAKILPLDQKIKQYQWFSTINTVTRLPNPGTLENLDSQE
ncbi:hypothetical protein DL95DRAFT_311014 [Leptodontidium sp. 2 PMI_412]|nr:hypothetical protein DL95DRAFT_311014 [Leptodontidium sp. 2 PMI_412]